jgi:hypothetical protein
MIRMMSVLLMCLAGVPLQGWTRENGACSEARTCTATCVVQAAFQEVDGGTWVGPWTRMDYQVLVSADYFPGEKGKAISKLNTECAKELTKTCRGRSYRGNLRLCSGDSIYQVTDLACDEN